MLNGNVIVCVSYVSIVVKISCGAHPQHHMAQPAETENLLKHCLLWLWYLCWCGFQLRYRCHCSPLFTFVLCGWLTSFALSTFCFLQTPSSILFYMRSECRTLKELSFHSFDVSKDELRLFPLVPCNNNNNWICCHLILLHQLQQQPTTLYLYQKQRKKLQLINFDLNKKVGSSGNRNNYDEIIKWGPLKGLHLVCLVR